VSRYMIGGLDNEFFYSYKTKEAHIALSKKQSIASHDPEAGVPEEIIRTTENLKRSIK